MRQTPLTLAPAPKNRMSRLLLPRDLPDLLRRVQALPSPAVVAIAGGSSTGKSTHVAAPLRAALGDSAALIAQDMQQGLRSRGLSGELRWDAPENYGLEETAEAIEAFRAGKCFDWPTWSFLEQAHGPSTTIHPAHVLLVEGLYAAHGALAAAADLVVYVEARAIVRLIRRVLRNHHERYPGRADPGRTAAGFLATVLLAHERCVRSQRVDAHLIVETDPAFERLRRRFDLPGLAPTAAVDVRRRIDVDAQTRASVVETVSGAVHLRVETDTACYVDVPIDAQTAQALVDLDADAW